jgi:two-component system, OmpR family, sensor histidine kinase CiaH
MKWLKTKRLAIAITAYWVLLAYIVAMLAWWFIALQTQNRQMAAYRTEAVRPDDPGYPSKLAEIRRDQQKETARNIGEGSTFLLSILVGAMFVYREVRRQIKMQQQQQNLMMAVTHELKTPIAVTKLNLETLQKHRLDEQKQQQLIRAALQETARLDTLANNILIASQLEGGGYIQAKEELDLSELVGQSVDDFKRRFPERKWDSSIEPGLIITGDRLLLQILVSNLTENAIKYTSREGAISIMLKKTVSHIILSVKDEGQGIPDDEKKKVFEKFYRSSNEKTRSKQGTGLGLWLCRKIAHDQRASLKLTDNSPAGSIFTVAF